MGLHPCGASAKTLPGPKPKRRPTQPAVEHNRSWEEVALPKQQVDVPKLMPEQPITVPPKRLLVAKLTIPKLTMPRPPITVPPKRLLIEAKQHAESEAKQHAESEAKQHAESEAERHAESEAQQQAESGDKQQAESGDKQQPTLHIKQIAKRQPKRCKPTQSQPLQGKHRALVWRDTEALP